MERVSKSIKVLPLYGALPLAQQDAAVRLDPTGESTRSPGSVRLYQSLTCHCREPHTHSFQHSRRHAASAMDLGMQARKTVGNMQPPMISRRLAGTFSEAAVGALLSIVVASANHPQTLTPDLKP